MSLFSGGLGQPYPKVYERFDFNENEEDAVLEQHEEKSSEPTTLTEGHNSQEDDKADEDSDDSCIITEELMEGGGSSREPIKGSDVGTRGKRMDSQRIQAANNDSASKEDHPPRTTSNEQRIKFTSFEQSKNLHNSGSGGKFGPENDSREHATGDLGGGIGYYGQSITENINTVTDQQRRDEKLGVGAKRGSNMVDDQYNKKQIEFKGGKLHQMITDQPNNNNKIYANRYQGAIGVWYFIIDSTFHFENILAILLLVMILYSYEYNQVPYSFAIVALLVNVSLMCIRNLTFEFRQRKVTNKINNKTIEFLMITRKMKRFVPISWADVKPGYILRVTSGQEFPADCLILDI